MPKRKKDPSTPTSCPECGQSEEGFEVEVTGVATIDDTGTVTDHSLEFGPDSKCTCGDRSCGHVGVVRDFAA